MMTRSTVAAATGLGSARSVGMDVAPQRPAGGRRLAVEANEAQADGPRLRRGRRTEMDVFALRHDGHLVVVNDPFVAAEETRETRAEGPPGHGLSAVMLAAKFDSGSS